jgi:hypothetical protein
MKLPTQSHLLNRPRPAVTGKAYPEPSLGINKCPRCGQDVYARKTNFVETEVPYGKRAFVTHEDNWTGWCMGGHQLTERRASKEAIWEELKKMQEPPKLNTDQLWEIYFNPEDPAPFDLWRHQKTGKLYRIRGVCLNANDGHSPDEKIVVYSVESATEPDFNWAQGLNDFLEKFEKVNGYD